MILEKADTDRVRLASPSNSDAAHVRISQAFSQLRIVRAVDMRPRRQLTPIGCDHVEDLPEAEQQGRRQGASNAA